MEIRAINHADFPVIATHEVRLVVLSVVIAVIASYTALDLAGRVTLTQDRARKLWLTGGAIAMGIGILAAVSFKLTDQPVEQSLHPMEPTLLAVTIGITALLILSLTLLISFLEQRISAETARRSDELEIRVEERTAQLKNANEQLRGEIVERQRAEEEVRFLQTMTQAISESKDFHSALEVTLRYVCEETGWNFGEAWIPSANGTILEFSSAWYGSNQNLEKFRQVSEGCTFAPATGLPGRVWSSRRPEWIQDVSSEPDTVFRRSRFAREAGFQAGLGIPIIDKNQVLAVLVFFMFESCQENKRLIEIVSTVATQLGSLIQRKRAEEALRESEERLHAIIDKSTAVIYVKDTQGQYILVNSWFETVFQQDAKNLKGKTDYDIFPQEMAEVFRANDQKVIEAGTALEWEEVAPQNDGLHTYLSIKFPLYDALGVPYAICGISTDITQRKQAEQALHSSYATNRALLNAIPDWMFHISKDGTFVNFKAGKDNNLLMPDEFLGKKLCEVWPQEVAVPIMDCVERALETGDIQIEEYQLLVNNTLRAYEARIVVSADDNEVMAIIRDITKRKRVEEDIRNALEKQKELSLLKSRFISMTSHEFRTPLTTILSSSQLLEKYSNKLAEEKKLQHLHRIQGAVKQMTELLNNVLLIGKAEAGKLQIKSASLDLGQFCRDLVEELQLSTGNNHTIAFCRQGECATACMDEKLLGSILINLLSNAIKYSPLGGTVHFDLICQQGEAIFHVQDQGIGIPTAEQAQLFNSFHRASNVGTISGTGLGLAIVKKSVDLHGGNITVNSEVGVGTTFTVTLPLNKQV